MPNNDWRIDTSWTYAIERDVAEGILDLTIDTAQAALLVAKKAVPNKSLSRGYATDALQDSGYVISKRGNGYRAAIEAAKSHDGGRVSRRGQIEGIFPLADFVDLSRRDVAVAVMDFPLSYAGLIQKGFYHATARKQIIGVDYIASAVNAVDDEYQRAARSLLATIMKKHEGNRAG